MRVRPRCVVGACVIAGAIAYLITTAVRNTAEYYLTVEEVTARRTELGGQALRIAGRVKPGSISWDPRSLTLAFTIVSIPEPDRPVVRLAAAVTPPSFHVVCKGQPKPDMLADGRDVIVEGQLGAGTEIAASQVMTSCPSKYAPKQPKPPAN
jgi:cytochrome c-type biogenesis protein CcmE